MSGIADGMLAIILVTPVAACVVELVIATTDLSTRRVGKVAPFGMLTAFVVAILLTGLLTSGYVSSATTNLGFWSELSEARSLPSIWQFRCTLLNATWLSVLTGLSWIGLLLVADDAQHAAWFHSIGCFATAIAIGFACSDSLLQSLFFWHAITWIVLLFLAWTSQPPDAARSIRGISAGLLTEMALVLAVVGLSHTAGADAFDELTTSESLAALSTRNPPLTALIGCLLVAAVIGRCGLFPCHGWLRASTAMHPAVTILVWTSLSVPSATWLLLKCQPVLLTSDVPASLLGGLGALGVVIGAFIACGQRGRYRLACLASSQVGVMMVAIASGHDEAIQRVLQHQVATSLAVFVLMSISWRRIVSVRLRSIIVWCAALSLAGAFPFWGGWTWHSLLELNISTQARTHVELVESTADSSPSTVEPGSSVPQIPAPRWDWIMGLWLAQAMTAFAVTATAMELTDHSVAIDSDDSATSSQFSPVVDLGLLTLGVLFVLGGLAGWKWLASNPATVGQLGVTQVITLGGILAGVRSDRGNTRSERVTPIPGSIARLSRDALNIDTIEDLIVVRPLALISTGLHFALNFDSRLLIEQLSKLPAWIGRQLESLEMNWVNFSVTVMLLATTALLLSLVLTT